MGSYKCSKCQGKKCGHDGEVTCKTANVIVELPLSDGTTVHVEAYYKGYSSYVPIKLNEKTEY